ncbi:MAG: hypothetical protein JWM97_2062 [Phycisphaerales bacterium]|nr:hypothetical protein [Phycisphaerales bacterium]
MYANADRQGRYPDTFKTLMVTEGITPEVFCCPTSDDQPAKSADQLSAGGHLSYIYLEGGLTKKLAGEGHSGFEGDSSFVIAFEPLKNHHGGGMNVVFADGRVQWLEAEQGKKLQAVAQSAGGKLVRWNGTAATVAATQP